jgi:hypothetical protein
MTDKNTPEKDPAKETPEKDSYEQRYKDLQATMTKTTQENATLKERQAKDEELLNAVTPFIDYDKMNGKVADPENGDELVSQQTLASTVQDLKNQISQNRTTQDFRSKHPDMIEHEDLVGMFLGKTNSREPMDIRIEKAVASAKALLESQQSKGRDLQEAEVKDKAAKEAEVAGLGDGKGPQSDAPAEKGETFDEYMQSRKDASAKAQGLI